MTDVEGLSVPRTPAEWRHGVGDRDWTVSRRARLQTTRFCSRSRRRRTPVARTSGTTVLPRSEGVDGTPGETKGYSGSPPSHLGNSTSVFRCARCTPVAEVRYGRVLGLPRGVGVRLRARGVFEGRNLGTSSGFGRGRGGSGHTLSPSPGSREVRMCSRRGTRHPEGRVTPTWCGSRLRRGGVYKWSFV